MDDLAVVGLDLETMHEVHIDDHPVWMWRAKGHNGNKTLVCLRCFQGVDVPTPRKVALIPRGRIGGRNRSHFAHPAGMGPVGSHSPESDWHANAKSRLRRWALQQPGVVSAVVEHSTPDSRRRSDVSVRFSDGRRVALEVQRQVITDAEWLARHADYASAGMVDVWLWHPSAGPPAVLYSASQPGWTFNLKQWHIGVAYGQRLSMRAEGRTNDDLDRYIDRWPPRPNDRVQLIWYSLDSFRLTTSGLQPPDAFRRRLAEQATEVREATASLAATKSRPQSSGQQSTTEPAHADTMHQVQLISAYPPWEDARGRDLYFCRACGNLTGEQARADLRHDLPPTPPARATD